MININGNLQLIWLDIKRVFRDIKYVSFVILMPIIFYLLYTEIFSENAAVGSVDWNLYSLVSMISFGIMGNSINLLGTKIADEKKKKWLDYIKVSPVNSKLYALSHLFSFLLISIIFTVLMFVIAYLTRGITLSIDRAVEIGFLLNLGSFVFLSLALIIGEFGSAAQPFGTIIYLLLSFVGGLWMPVAAMPKTMAIVAKWLPSYNYAKIGWDLLDGKMFDWKVWGILFTYTFFFSLIYYIIVRTKRED
ncbi:ABC transporter permease [Bacillus cytotoxicus]|uniref:ABC transporter permease n=1 Tax=Bacillus cytotoxicus TaxID=580165 RepID=UPI00195082E1|nr:ABC transporter permease [Bacillus cytotoxicus]MDH2860031.1 ABC transporter permease [Bacillus cytotoxicus]MDH2869568.1 ABC transporter permease [Bacillus cytotoxicus]MDH2873782.1 ABC transporter permease [Bacillus cytotoxicus]MDH2876483.1 ABC transporter permease [Bacillus cytotoxicus]MDH2892322.1 ABC transporter permease [Bacillus cytotoxicus]